MPNDKPARRGYAASRSKSRHRPGAAHPDHPQPAGGGDGRGEHSPGHPAHRRVEDGGTEPHALTPWCRQSHLVHLTVRGQALAVARAGAGRLSLSSPAATARACGHRRRERRHSRDRADGQNTPTHRPLPASHERRRRFHSALSGAGLVAVEPCVSDGEKVDREANRPERLYFVADLGGIAWVEPGTEHDVERRFGLGDETQFSADAR